MVHVLLKKPGLENFEHYFASVWDEWNCMVVWRFFGIAFLRDWNENWHFPFLGATAKFSKFAGILSAALLQHHLLGFGIAQLEFHHFHELCLYWCFVRPTWVRTPCLALGEWSHHHGYLDFTDDKREVRGRLGYLFWVPEIDHECNSKSCYNNL